MHKILKYRVIAFSLALIFCVFNVGLPIVVASCPMMKAGKMPGSSCCMMRVSKTPVLHKAMMTGSCCKTVFAAERNKTEFLQVDAAAHAINGGMVFTPLVLPHQEIQQQIVRISYNLADDSPPYALSDRSVLFSTLLI